MLWHFGVRFGPKISVAFSMATMRRALGNAQGGRERLPGYDLTFRAPKSVSLLFAVGEGEVSR
jgi:hypothetical protein